jgi:chromate transporter
VLERIALWGSLFWGFFQVGILGFGGGPGSVGIIQAVTVDTNHWLTPDQFGAALAVGNSLPGPLATKMAAWIGYRVGGWGGLVAGVLGLILPSMVLMLAAFALIQRYQRNPFVAGALAGIRPVVGALLLLLVWELVPHTGPIGHVALYAGVGLAALAALYVLRIPAVWVVLGGMAVGALLMRPGA